MSKSMMRKPKLFHMQMTVITLTENAASPGMVQAWRRRGSAVTKLPNGRAVAHVILKTISLFSCCSIARSARGVTFLHSLILFHLGLPLPVVHVLLVF